MPHEIDLAPWIHIDYKHILPATARLPLWLGHSIAWLRGLIYAIVNFDWRDHAIGYSYVRSRTRQAMDILLPSAATSRRFYNTTLRYIHHSREEWQACLFGHDVMNRIKLHSNIDHLDLLKACHQNRRGLVLVSCHLDSFCLGMVLMGMHGLPVNVINTAMIEDSRIHPAVRQFFQRKYRAMEHRMQGRMPYYQSEMPYFEKSLNAGQIVVLMGDIPGTKSDCWINWLGRSFRMPLGAWHMARRTNSLISAFVCIHEGIGRYRVVMLPPREIDPKSPKDTCKPLYSFMESWIRQYPERWISSDLLPGYEALS